MDGVTATWRRVTGDPRRRDAGTALVLALVGVLLLAVGLADVSGLPWDPPTVLAGRWWHTVPLLLGCALVLVRSSWGDVALLAVLPVLALDLWLGGSTGVYVVLVDFLYWTVLVTTPSRVRKLIAAVVVVSVGLSTVVFVATGDTQGTTLTGLQLFAFLGTPVWWGYSVRQQAELARLAAGRAQDLQRLAELREAQVVRDERARMAQDLHDALSSHLSAIAIHSGAALAGPAAEAAHDTSREQSLRAIREASVGALEDLREMILLLQTGADPVTPPAHLDQIDDLVQATRAAGLEVELHGDPGAVGELPATVEHAAYRIVQESLTNAAKHAPGSQVLVSLQQRPPAGGDPGTLVLEVASRPRESTATQRRPPGSGMGLVGMRERTVAVGGTFSAGWQDTGADRWWVVAASLPVREVVQP